MDLTEVSRVNSMTPEMLLTEIGPDLDRFPTAAAPCSWSRLCPSPKISGGQVLSLRTRPTENRAALVLRMAARTLHCGDSFLGYYSRRMKAHMGTPKAINAAAHELSRIICHMVTLPNNHTTPPSFRRRRCAADTRNQPNFTHKPVSSNSNPCQSLLYLERAEGSFGEPLKAA